MSTDYQAGPDASQKSPTLQEAWSEMRTFIRGIACDGGLAVHPWAGGIAQSAAAILDKYPEHVEDMVRPWFAEEGVPRPTLASGKLAIKLPDSRLARGGWAPGNYLCTCIHCDSTFTGDKRATSCADCAYKDAPPPESAAP